MKNNSPSTPDFTYLFALTEKVTPLAKDCGKLCQSICCQPQKDKILGMYLFPGEEIMYTGKEPWLKIEKQDPGEYDFPENWTSPVYFVTCTKQCPREKRPLSCRLFPLAPHFLDNKKLVLIYETINLPYTCPLIQKKIPLEKNFIETTAKVWQELLQDPRIYTLVSKDSKQREEEKSEKIDILWASSL